MVVLLSLSLICSVTFTFGDVIAESNGVGLRHTALDGFVFNGNILFALNVSSTVQCASECLKYEPCLTFTTSPKDPTSLMMTCQGHDMKMASDSSKLTVAGSKTYHMDKPISGNVRGLPSFN